MAEGVLRSVFFYGAQPLDDAVWNRRDVLAAIQALEASPDDLYLEVSGGDVVFAIVDKLPTGSGGYGRLRLFRSRRSNLPAVEDLGRLSELDIPSTAGLAEPCHIILAPNGLVAAEYNHFAPRLTMLSHYIGVKLGLRVNFAVYVQQDIVQRLDRLEDVRLLELSMKPNENLDEQIPRDDPIGDALYSAMQIPGERRVAIAFSGDRKSAEFTSALRSFARKLLSQAPTDLDAEESATTVFRVKGYDPVSEELEVVDLLRQKVVRRVEVERQSPRSRALDRTDAYRTIEKAATEARKSDLKNAVLAWQ